MDEEEEEVQTRPLADISGFSLQRQVEEEEEEKTAQAKGLSGQTRDGGPSLEQRISNLRGGGQPLPESTRAFFEPRFGQDFSEVSLRTDTSAAESAKAINARAFTAGHTISFGSGQYSPETSSGKGLLAHELTHVVQQRSEPTRQVRRQPEEKTTAHETGSDVLATIQKAAPLIVRSASILMDQIISFLKRPTVLWLLKKVHKDPERLIDTLEKEQKPALFIIEYAVNNPGKVIEAIKNALGQQISAAVEAEARKHLSPLGKHFEGVWRHVKVRLDYLKENWWPILKDVGWSFIWPIPNTIKDVQKLADYLGNAWDNLNNWKPREGIEDILNAWREGNALVGRYYGWIFLASVILGGIIGGVAGAFAGGVGAIPGALAGIKIGAVVATKIGLALLISAIAAEVAMIVKSMDDIRVSTTEVALEKEYGQIADSALALGIMGAFMVLGALAARFARGVLSRIRGLFRRKPGEKLTAVERREAQKTMTAEKVRAQEIQQGIQKVDQELAASSHKRHIPKEDIDWLNADFRRKELAYDPEIGSYRITEAKTALAAEQQGILPKPIRRSIEPGIDFIDGVGRSWSFKGTGPKQTVAEIVDTIVREASTGRNTLGDLTAMSPAEAALVRVRVIARLTRVRGAGRVRFVSPGPSLAEVVGGISGREVAGQLESKGSDNEPQN